MFEKIIEKINNASCVGIVVHVNPDGDALGSAYSLKLILENMGKTANICFSGKVEGKVVGLLYGLDDSENKALDWDLMIALDCADAKRLGEWREAFEKHGNTAAIDHHITHVKYADEAVVRDMSSTCELMYSFYKEMGIEMTKEIASNIYLGIVTDTGNFKYSSVTGDTHRIAAELLECGVEFAEISKVIYDTVSKGYLELKMRAINSMKYYLGGRVAVLELTNADFEATGIDEAEASPLVTLPCMVEGVEVGVYIRERKADEFKISLRSARYVDVAELSTLFGGGGHVRAAGYSILPEELDKNIEVLLKEIEARL